MRSSTRDVLQSLSARGLFDGAKTPAARALLEKPGIPLHLQALTGVGAWLAAVFFIGSLLVLGGWRQQALLTEGLILIGLATGLRAASSRIFPVQFALAMSMAGHALALVGMGEQADSALAITGLATVLCVALYPLYRDPVHRFLSCLTALVAIEGWLIDARLHHGLHALLALEVIGLGALFLRRGLRPSLRPLAFALAVAGPGLLATFCIGEMKLETTDWPARVILTAGLIALVRRIGGRREPALLAILATIALGAFTAPGLLAAIGLLVLGYHRRERLLVGLGIASFAGFLGYFYYSLQMDLGMKSALLMGSGLVLLGARRLLAGRPWARKESA